MLKSISKNLIRLVIWSSLILISVIVYYILDGHKHYSLLKNNELTIISQVKNQFNVDLKYDRLEETWVNFRPMIVIDGLVVHDNHNNELKAQKLKVNLDLIELLMKNTLRFKEIKANDVYLVYNEIEDSGNDSTFDLSILDKIQINKISFDNFNFSYNLLNKKQYALNNVSLSYKDVNDYIQIAYNNIDLYQYIPTKENPKSKTVLRGDTKDIIKTIQRFDGQKFLDIAQYDKVFNIEGRIRVEINLDKMNDDMDYGITINIPDNTVNLLSEKLKFEHFKGSVYYTKKDGLTSDKLTCQFKGKECSLIITNKKMQDVFFDFEAIADKSVLDKYVPYFKDTTFTGTTKIIGKYSSLLGKPDILTINSDLVGLKIDAIPLLSKSVDQLSPLQIMLTMSDKMEVLEVNNSNIQIFVDLMNHGNTQIYIDKKKTFSSSKDNLVVEGTINDMNVDDIISFIDSLNIPKNNSVSVFTYALNITAKKPSYLGFKPENVVITNNGHVLNLDINDPKMIGVVIYDLDEKLLNVDFDKFYYDISESSNSNMTFDLNLLPEMRVNVEDLKVGTYTGHLTFNGKKIDKSYVFDSIVGKINGLEPTFMIKLSNDNNEITTEIISNNNQKLVELNDIGKVLAYYGYVNTMTSQKAVLLGTLNWKGFVPNLKTLSGKISFELDDGRINTVSAGQKTLSLFRVFEMNTLNQLFKLDFDIVKSGLKYQSIKGAGVFDNGEFKIDKENPITMKSESFNAKLTGKIDFSSERFDNRLVVDLPVSQKLPTVALLAGGPLAAAGVWVVDKMIGEKLNSLMSISFALKGSFAKPDVVK